MSAPVAAIVLAGGRGSRLGGVDKASLLLAGERLVDRVVRAARTVGVTPIIVVGPETPGLDGCTRVTESPRFGGPLVALEAGVRALAAEAGVRGADADADAGPGPRPGSTPEPGTAAVLLLACDLVHPKGIVQHLLAAGRAPGESVVLRDPDGRAQWLAGCYDLAALHEGLAAARAGGELTGAPLRRALRDLPLRFVDAPAEVLADIDEPGDLARAIASDVSAERGVADPPMHTPRGVTMSAPAHLPPEALEAWLAAAAEALQLDPAEVSIATVLDLARDVAHGVARPAAPLTTFLLGLAYGRALTAADPVATDPAAPGHETAAALGSDAAPALEDLAGTLTRLALRWEAPQ